MQSNSDYRILPPGRTRRMSYAREHQTRSNSYLNLLNTEDFFSYQSSTIHRSLSNIDLGDPFNIDTEDHSPIQALTNIIHQTLTNIDPLGLEDFFSYESLSRLSDIKKGLISTELLNNSVVLHNNDNDEFCVICQMTCTKTCIMRRLSCNHTFHINCIDKWFTLNKTCPICKFEIK